MDLLLGGGKRSLGEVPFVAEVSHFWLVLPRFSLCACHNLGTYNCFTCYSTTISLQKVFVLPCSYLGMGPEVPRSWVAQMAGKFFWGCSVLLWDSACCGLCDLGLLCVSVGTASSSLLVPCAHYKVSEAAFTSILILNFPAQFTWLFSETSLWVHSLEQVRLCSLAGVF